jgi:cytochrome oxidase Cu insertion factor (SCO1/SenC/PrrC family)
VGGADGEAIMNDDVGNDPATRPSRSWFPFAMSLAIAFVVGSILFWLGPKPMKEPSDGDAPDFQPASIDRPIPDFRLFNQEGKEVTRDDLSRKIWVAGFIFTRCRSICPTVSATMAELSKALPKDVMLVSFSVDPKFDTPEVLAKYANNCGADSSRWWFLTGERDQIYKISRDGFQLAVEENAGADEGDLVTHSSRVIIVDRTGVARQSFVSLDPSTVDRVVRAVEKIHSQQSR